MGEDYTKGGLMKKCHLLVIMLIVFVVGSSAFAGSEQDNEIIRSTADIFLSGMPDSSYLISADDLLQRLQSGKGDFLIVDVRDREERYKAGHIPGAIYINFRDVAKPENLAKLPKDKDIILYCNTGHEENKALTVLRMLGYKAYALKFGYVAWKKEKPTDAMLAAIENASKKNYPVEQ